MQDSPKVVKFEVGDLLPVGMVLVVTGVALAYGLQTIGEVRDDTCRDDGGFVNAGNCYHNASFVREFRSAQYNGTADTVTGVKKLPDKMPLIATVLVAAVVLGIVVRYLSMGTQ